MYSFLWFGLLSLVVGQIQFQVLPTQTIGVATWYSPEDYSGPLYCAPTRSRLRHDRWTLDRYRWVAVDVKAYKSGEVRCWDLLSIRFEDGQTVQALALDAGPFDRFYIEDYPSLPILVDFPQEQWPLSHRLWSAVVEVTNLDGR